MLVNQLNLFDVISPTRKPKKPEPQWSEFQMAVFSWLLSGNGHAMINSVAGSGKTKTIEGAVNRTPATLKVAVLTFNRHVSQELQHRLPKSLHVGTCHGMGLHILTRHFSGRKVVVDQSKYPALRKKAFNRLVMLRAQYEADMRQSPDIAKKKYPVPVSPVGKKEEKSKKLERAIKRFLKQCVHYVQVTLSESDPKSIQKLIEHFAIEAPLDEFAVNWVITQVPLILQESEELAKSMVIGLEDLTWLPNKWDLDAPQKDILIIDEAQDANRAQMGIYLKMVAAGGRIIAVGDERQAIMGFAGSDAHSWDTIRSLLTPTELDLSVCYRCPSSHIELAQKIVPQIKAREDAPEGGVYTIDQEKLLEVVKPNDLIICRFKAPVVKFCLKFLANKQSAKVRGTDIGRSLASIAREAHQEEIFPGNFCSNLNQCIAAKIQPFLEEENDEEVEALNDTKNAILVCFSRFGSKHSNIQGFCREIESIFSDETQERTIILSTIHRAKGDEADNVFVLNSETLPYTSRALQQWQVVQEHNLLYVALTRAKSNLYFVPFDSKYLVHPTGGATLVDAESDIEAGQ